MSKILTKRNTSFQSINVSKKNTLKVKRNTFNPLIKTNNSMLYNNNNLLYSEHFSPSSKNIKSSLSPPLNTVKKKVINSQKKTRLIKLINSNSLNDIYSSSNLLSPRIRQFIDREYTQPHLPKKINILKDIKNNDKINNIFTRIKKNGKINNENREKYKCKIKQINNINNINNVNIHIYSNNIKLKNEKNELNTINTNKTNKNYSFIGNNMTNDKIIDKNILNGKNKNFYKKNKNSKGCTLTPKKKLLKKYYTKTEHKFETQKKNRIKNDNQFPFLASPETPLIIKYGPKERTYKNPKSKKYSELSNLTMTPNLTITPNDSIISINDYKNNSVNKDYKSSTFKILGKMILNKNNNSLKKQFNRRFQLDMFDYFDEKEKEKEKLNKTIVREDNSEYKKYKHETINVNKKYELSNINEIKYFLKEFNNDNNKILILFLKLIQIHMDIELLLTNKINNNFSKKSSTTTITTTITISDDKIDKLISLINNYFSTISILEEYTKFQDNNINSEAKSNKNTVDEANGSNSFLYQKYNIFNFNTINNLFQKCIKIQICYYAALLITLSHSSDEDLDDMIATYFEKNIKEISSPLYNIFRNFAMNEIRDKYTKLLLNNIRLNFFDNFNKLYYEEKTNPSLKKSEILENISKNITNNIDSLKHYCNINLKSSIIKPFGDAFSQMLHSIERKTLNKFINIFLNVILFGELDINREKMQKNLDFQNKINIRSKIKKNPNIYEGSALFNNISDNAPYLPAINGKYKYTLVLDMDETLVHFFFTELNGMFFVRPYCLEFLNEINKYYEIVAFTAGIKEYADNILNLLDVNDNIIKFRLYRQHVTVAGFNSYKNLKLLGRDIKKVIIIDNLKENFALQPDNGLFIKTWTSDVNDTQFIDLLNILKNIAISNVNDVRPIIRKINEKIKYNGDLINPYSKINIKRIIDDEKK